MPDPRRISPASPLLRSPTKRGHRRRWDTRERPRRMPCCCHSATEMLRRQMARPPRGPWIHVRSSQGGRYWLDSGQSAYQRRPWCSARTRPTPTSHLTNPTSRRYPHHPTARSRGSPGCPRPGRHNHPATGRPARRTSSRPKWPVSKISVKRMLRWLVIRPYLGSLPWPERHCVHSPCHVSSSPFAFPGLTVAHTNAKVQRIDSGSSTKLPNAEGHVE